MAKPLSPNSHELFCHLPFPTSSLVSLFSLASSADYKLLEKRAISVIIILLKTLSKRFFTLMSAQNASIEFLQKTVIL